MNGIESADKSLGELLNGHQLTKEKTHLQKVKCFGGIALSNIATLLLCSLFTTTPPTKNGPSIPRLPPMKEGLVRVRLPIHLQVPIKDKKDIITIALYDSTGNQVAQNSTLYAETLKRQADEFSNNSVTLFTVDLPQKYLKKVVKLTGRPVWGYPINTLPLHHRTSRKKEILPYEIVF